MSFGGHRPRKRFGQHWLVDPLVLQRIVTAADLQPGERVLEVGPGRGALTERLLAAPLAALHAVELDRDLVAGLRQRFGADPRFRLSEGDVLSLRLDPPDQPPADKVVANIPYNITGPLLERLLGRLDAPRHPPYRRLVLLLQQEVAERIRARPGSSAFSALSVRMQLMARCRSVCTVPPRCFRPPPKVTSEVVSLEPLPIGEVPEPALARTLEQLLHRCFGSRRKMLRNTLMGLLEPDRLESLALVAGIGLQQRPQEIAPERWLALAAGLNRAAARPGCPATSSPAAPPAPPLPHA